MFLQGQSKIIREGDWGTLASALIFSAKPLTDNNVEVKSLERGGGGQNFSVVRDPWFGLKILRRDFPIFGLGPVGRGRPLLWCHHWLNHGLHGHFCQHTCSSPTGYTLWIKLYCIPFSCGSCHVTWWFFRWNCPFSCHRRIRHWKESYSGKWTPNILRGMKSCQWIVFSFFLYLNSFEI